jgi:TIR domain
VFYDEYETVDLWGKDLYRHLSDVYRNRARYCVIFISQAYAKNVWPKHELTSAQARAFEENREYILPARFDETELPGLLPTTGYIDLRLTTPIELAALILRKLAVNSARVSSDVPLSHVDATTYTNAPIIVRPLWTHPVGVLKTVWHSTVWTKMLVIIIAGALCLFGGYILWRALGPHRLDSVTMPVHQFSDQSCNSVTLNAQVDPDGVETVVWFEWGETPELGKITSKQRFSDKAVYYQDLIGLKENTTYFYRAMATDKNRTSEGRVFSFTTARCSPS